MAVSFALLRELGIEVGGRDVVALEQGPGVLIGIGGVHRADDVEGQTLLGLVSIEGFEWAGEDDPAKIPQNGSNSSCHLVRLGRIVPVRPPSGGTMARCQS
ncbi:MAG: hypothetical protein RLZ18_1345 [Actinomycetota bacterium]